MKKLFFISILTSVLISCNSDSSKSKKNNPHKKSVGAGEDFIRAISKEQEQEILLLIQLFKKNDVDRIVDRIAYPLHRDYPIPAIENKEQMRTRFYEVFDEKLITEIASSNVDDWSTVGWRGIMLDQGIVWLSDDAKSITGINYQSSDEKVIYDKLIETQKAYVHESISRFKRPVLSLITSNYMVRIDEMSDETYRYSSWKLGVKQTEKPDLILTNGVLDFSGSSGNHVYTFTQGKFRYRVYRNLLGEGNYSPVRLEVEKEDKVIINQTGSLLHEQI